MLEFYIYGNNDVLEFIVNNNQYIIKGNTYIQIYIRFITPH